ncbi:MAG: hypothetical protein WC869_08135 [Phycisphaerae bacterium]|jgi:hypothetical protein
MHVIPFPELDDVTEQQVYTHAGSFSPPGFSVLDVVGTVRFHKDPVYGYQLFKKVRNALGTGADLAQYSMVMATTTVVNRSVDLAASGTKTWKLAGILHSYESAAHPGLKDGYVGWARIWGDGPCIADAHPLVAGEVALCHNASGTLGRLNKTTGADSDGMYVGYFTSGTAAAAGETISCFLNRIQ